MSGEYATGCSVSVCKCMQTHQMTGVVHNVQSRVEKVTEGSTE